jgi:DNA invertase Pin-like site-specific DNA recombinase
MAQRTKAFAYLRTSSAANVGEDKDSPERQLVAIGAYAKSAGIELVGTYYDPAVRGEDLIEARPGFAAMLEAIEGNGIRTIIVETANRFARDLMVQEVGFAMLKARGISLIAADSPTSFLDDTPTARLIRQVLGAVSEFEKAMLVAKLRGARERKRKKTGRKVEGRKSMFEKRPEVVAMAKELAGRRKPRLSLLKIAAALEEAGFVTSKGKRFSASQVSRILQAKTIALAGPTALPF